jgi:hypothetical protein
MAKPKRSPNITAEDLIDAMGDLVLLITKNGESRNFRSVSKQIHYRPSNGEFIISADGKADKVVLTVNQAVDTFNAINLGALS